ncbi:MAG TPA: tripartite tricarboxylate transporter TctB family protein [Thermodesulfobacteriota bacterium]|nr:tripartite tricarboxylate transporter TctB family protein [Thermodesulfobacteriota bacterium]
MPAKIQKVCYVVFLAIGSLYLFGSLRLPIGTAASPQGGLFPLLVSIFLIAMSVALIMGVLTGRRTETVEAFPKGHDRNRLLILASALVLYSLLLKPLGYLVSTIGLMGVTVHLMGLRGWGKVAAAAVITGILSYYLFAFLLDVPLPRGEVFP